MLKILSIILIVAFLMTGASVKTEATGTACVGVVLHTPVGLGLPVMETPAFFTGAFAGFYVQVGQTINVYQTVFNPTIGDIWFLMDSGWVQAYSGYTTGISQIILADFPCSKSLPHYMGE